MKTILFVLVGIFSLAVPSMSRAANFIFDSGPAGPNMGGTPENPYLFGILPLGTSTVSVSDHNYGSGQSNFPFHDLFTFSLTAGASVTFTMTPGLHTAYLETTIQHSRNDPGGNTIIAQSNGGGPPPNPGDSVVVIATLAPGNYEFFLAGLMPPNPPDNTSYTDENYSGGIAVTAIALKVVSITHPASNTIHLQCLGVPNAVNRIKFSPDLSPDSFTLLTSITADATGAFQYDDTNAGAKKFYRLAYP